MRQAPGSAGRRAAGLRLQAVRLCPSCVSRRARAAPGGWQLERSSRGLVEVPDAAPLHARRPAEHGARRPEEPPMLTQVRRGEGAGEGWRLHDSVTEIRGPGPAPCPVLAIFAVKPPPAARPSAEGHGPLRGPARSGQDIMTASSRIGKLPSLNAFVCEKVKSRFSIHLCFCGSSHSRHTLTKSCQIISFSH